jgi:hypothetical protein
MNSRRRHFLFLAASIPFLFAAGTLCLKFAGLATRSSVQALAWAEMTAWGHAAAGWFLWKRKSSGDNARIASGLVILAVRFLVGVGALVTGIVIMPGEKVLLAATWAAMYLAFQVSESVFFFQGVQEL